VKIEPISNNQVSGLLAEGGVVTGHEELKEIYRGIIEAVTRGDAGALDDVVSTDIVDHNPIPDQLPGLEGLKQWMAAFRRSFPDLGGTIEDVLAEGDRVAAWVTWRGTQRGDFLGVPPTNKQVSFAAFHIVRFSRGRAVEWWGTGDLLGALQQIGATVSGP
jgi:steroid delta-isomerase-like uncharacterized protein